MQTSQAPGFDYVAEANVTLSHQYHNQLVGYGTFMVALENAIHALKALDNIKKTLYYGKDTGLPRPVGDACMPHISSDNQIIMHGIIGLATEAGELLEQVFTNMTGEAEQYDKVNVKEETGDAFWYIAALCDVFGFTFEEVQRTNIAKLRARYKDKFDAYDANNRDLAAERAVLETSCASHPATVVDEGCVGCMTDLPYPTSGEHIALPVAESGQVEVNYSSRPNNDG